MMVASYALWGAATLAGTILVVLQFHRWWARKRPESAAFGVALMVLTVVASCPLWAHLLDERNRGLIRHGLAGSSTLCFVLLYVAHYLGWRIDSGDG
jgi:hypothetical protein